ncbi:MAG: hypothetical protein HYW45_01345 [Candidatus Daviesbacteria bacterium]|nr:MAG: hypothetical protein HYW45_01345 [Candidatus Daviesbacteria bacterium]
MKRDLVEQIKNLDNKELVQRIKTARAEIQDLILDKNMNKLTDRKAVFKKRKELALLQTVLRQKQFLEELETKNEVNESKKGGKQTKVVVDNLAEKAKKQSKTRTKSVQKK